MALSHTHTHTHTHTNNAFNEHDRARLMSHHVFWYDYDPIIHLAHH